MLLSLDTTITMLSILWVDPFFLWSSFNGLSEADIFLVVGLDMEPG